MQRKHLWLGFFLCVLFVAPLTLAAQQNDPEHPAYKVEDVLQRVMITSIVWAPDGRMFWTEKMGVVGTMSPDGKVQDQPVVQVEVHSPNEDGLLSIALDPKFSENHYFYIFYSAPASPTNPALANLVIRYVYSEENGVGVGKSPLQLLRIEIPNNNLDLHNGGRLKFGPKDGYLYVSVGDMGERGSAQDLNKIGGKIHRFAISNNTLVPAPGNPFPGSTIWAYGVRNTFAYDFDIDQTTIFATENGPDCDDEINRMIAGGNYGWTSDINCKNPLPQRQAIGIKPLIDWSPTIAPTGIIVYKGAAFPGWQGEVFQCSWKLEQLTRYRLNKERTQFDGPSEPLNIPRTKHCTIELAVSPEGYIYYTDTVGMYRIVPK